MAKMVELANYGVMEFCILDIETGKVYHLEKPQYSHFTGWYFSDGNTFFGVYPDGRKKRNIPIVFTAWYRGKEYPIHKGLTIEWEKDGKDRIFKIQDYGIEIHYQESPFIGIGEWLSDEDDVDLFCMIAQRYRDDEFYEWWKNK